MISSDFPNENSPAIMTIRFWTWSFSWTHLGWAHFLKAKQKGTNYGDRVILHGGEAQILTKAENIRVPSTWWVLRRTPAAWLKRARSGSLPIGPSGICGSLALAHLQSEEWRPCKYLHPGKRAKSRCLCVYSEVTLYTGLSVLHLYGCIQDITPPSIACNYTGNKHIFSSMTEP